MAEVIEINTLEELAGYRMAWNALLAETPRASFFHTYDWLETYWRHYGYEEGVKFRVLVVRAADSTIGIVPLVERDEPRQFGTLRVLGYPLDNWGCWYGPIGANQAATLTLAMRHLASTTQDWDQIDLRWIDHAGSDRRRTCRALKAAGFLTEAEPDITSSVLEFNGDWQHYLSSLDSKTRHEIRRKRRRLSEMGDVEFIRYRPLPACQGGGDPHWELYDQCETIAKHSWQAESTDGNTLCDHAHRSFFRDTHAAAARLGMLDLNLLRVNGKPVAFNYNYHYEDCVFGLRMGFNKDLPMPGVGAVLLAMTIEDGFDRGDARLEMGVGNQDYKQRYGVKTETGYRLIHAPINSWRSQAARLGRWARTWQKTPEPVGK